MRSIVCLIAGLALTACAEPAEVEAWESESAALGAMAAAPVAVAADDVAARPRIEVSLKIEDTGAELLIPVRFYNPYRCNWRGDLYVEREAPDGTVNVIHRWYGAIIPGGASFGATFIVPRPDDWGKHRFSAAAYVSDGEDKAPYFNRRILQVQAVRMALVPVEVEAEAALLACADDRVEVRPPIWVDLVLRVGRETIEALGMWENMTRTPWKGDLYVDMTSPSQEIDVLRRDLGTLIDAGIGFCTFDEIDRPAPPGRYTFQARALHRDGWDEETWTQAGTTEIIAVCNRRLCELIEPDQQRAELTLTGPSWIHLETDFFSEFTSVTMAYGGRTFDITEWCEIEQYPGGGDRNHVEVYFDTMNLPIGPRTWADYTVQLHPMPVVPPGAKTSDSIKALTNGPE